MKTRAAISFDDACELLETVLSGADRAGVLDAVQDGTDFTGACARLRAAMRSHTLPATNGTPALSRIVRCLDDRTRNEGFHVLESWDYRAHRFASEIAPVLMLDRHTGREWCGDGSRAALAVLLDQYLLTILGLCAVRAWDEGDANANLDRVTRLVGFLQESGGSGHRFVDDAETLLLLAISHYHPDERAYNTLIQKVWSLDDAHRLKTALACAGALGSHLRWGLRYMYKRDVGLMRDDNLVDYPWLLFSAATLMRAYQEHRGDHDDVVEGLMNAFTADPWAFTGSTPQGMRDHAAEHDVLRDALRESAGQLSADFEAHRPSAKAYSPLAFHCNFLCNAFVAMVATALVDEPAHPSLNGLFTRRSSDAAERYARRLVSYAGGGLIAYDPYEATHAFNLGTQVLAQAHADQR